MMDVIYERMNDDCEEYFMPKDKGVSQIQQFYAGKKILLTGCTGYVGKTVMEKLLRTCKDLDTIYVLVRTKKQKSIHQRMEEYFKNIIFERLHREHPGFRKKVVVIHGDLMKPDLGISSEDRKLLTDNVDIIIHNAASVYFDEKVAFSLQINVLGTAKILELAEECRNIKALIYVSTAYSHCYRQHIEEKFYPAPADLKMVMDIIRADNENTAGISKEALADIQGQWANIYTFTKSISESLVEEFGKRVSFPCGVYRPSIVTATSEEPIAGWCGNTNGPVLAIIGIFLGIFHVCQIIGDPVVDTVPADMATNALLAAVWDLAVFKKPKEPQMYNYGSSKLNPAHLYNFYYYSNKIGGLSTPTIRSVWCYFMVFASNYYVAYAYHIVLHFIPAVLAEMFVILRGKKPFVLKVFMKGHRNLRNLYAFANGNWLVDTDAIQGIWSRMNQADHENFNSDIRRVDWLHYMELYWAGIRVYLLNDTMDTLPAAKKKDRRLRMLHNTLSLVLKFLAVYVLYRVACYVLSFL